MASWDKLAKDDALWAVLSDDDRANQKWDKDEFFATGVSDVQGLLSRLEKLGERPDFTRALDFGCGVGRLTQALSAHFQEVDGIDISQVMIEKAAHLKPTPRHVRFLHNPRADFSQLNGRMYSFILSLICLQHMPEKFALRYLRAMCSVLAPGGLAYLQMGTYLNPALAPALKKLDRDDSRLNRVYRGLRTLVGARKPPRMETYYCRLSATMAVLEEHRMRLVAILPDASLPEPFVSHVIVFKRPG